MIQKKKRQFSSRYFVCVCVLLFFFFYVTPAGITLENFGEGPKAPLQNLEGPFGRGCGGRLGPHWGPGATPR